MANVLTVVAKVRAAKGKGDALAALLVEQVKAVRAAEPGCLVYRPHRSTKDPDVFIFYEQYKDDAAFDAHRKAPHLAAAPGEGGARRGHARGRDLSLRHRLTRRRTPWHTPRRWGGQRRSPRPWRSCS